jgi:lipopolysaccharide/colanic/teichoic acid biosynthesis glycosyltransferase
VVEVDDDAVVIDLREPIEAPVCSARGKTALEWALALLATLLLLPVLLVLGAIISISSGGTFWYSQVRVGRGGQLFRCYKLRSMVKNADAALHDLLERDPEARAEFERDWKLSNDPRITTIGKILRKTSLDELPQLINVLKGEMALVGPRPVVPDELSRYGHHVSEVLSVRPGLTGLWQVSGRNDVSYAQRVQLDVAYVRERSVPLDVSIIARTALQCVVPSGNGAR